MIDQSFQFIAEEVQLKFNKISAYTNHGPSIGAYREAIIEELIENFISDRFSIKTGFIYDPNSEFSSKQMDILIIDENFPAAYFLKTSNFVVASKEAVVCAIEIKSNLTKANLKDICEKCTSVKKISKDIDFIGFCFKSSIGNESLPNAYSELMFSETHYSDLITVLGRGSILKLGQGTFYEKDEDEAVHHRLTWSPTPDFYTSELKIFLSYIMKSCFSRDEKTEHPLERYKPSLGLIHNKKFVFGTET
ncbi:hypothetical protein MHM98_10530 [Psychrobium sp. MM17-31]|uniref:DUF6602 domain-containing protein n=1 Tax=Psychrobium sp. MM17-31 TaxID=2917758 RepID=UPI001EF3E6B2|nr:DUF6602 domain-containing protein [Psychrobium sp. MM17-31]MCG7531778.1 hypothetical protein [Psychrobium sp. MM17-31]